MDMSIHTHATRMCEHTFPWLLSTNTPAFSLSMCKHGTCGESETHADRHVHMHVRCSFDSTNEDMRLLSGWHMHNVAGDVLKDDRKNMHWRMLTTSSCSCTGHFALVSELSRIHSGLGFDATILD